MYKLRVKVWGKEKEFENIMKYIGTVDPILIGYTRPLTKHIPL
jgi:hypothetical protein